VNFDITCYRILPRNFFRDQVGKVVVVEINEEKNKIIEIKKIKNKKELMEQFLS